MPKEGKKWEIFKDRTESLLERWQKFHKEHPDIDDELVIRICMSEINDDYTQALMRKEKSMRIVVMAPGQQPEVKEIKNTLEELQGVVGGCIEIALNVGKYILVCNKEDKLLRLDFNKRLGDLDYLVGTVFLTKDDGHGNFTDLNEKDIEAVLALWDCFKI